jgi:hypothetical protein
MGSRNMPVGMISAWRSLQVVRKSHVAQIEKNLLRSNILHILWAVEQKWLLFYWKGNCRAAELQQAHKRNRKPGQHFGERCRNVVLLSNNLELVSSI